MKSLLELSPAFPFFPLKNKTAFNYDTNHNGGVSSCIRLYKNLDETYTLWDTSHISGKVTDYKFKSKEEGIRAASFIKDFNMLFSSVYYEHTLKIREKCIWTDDNSNFREGLEGSLLYLKLSFVDENSSNKPPHYTISSFVSVKEKRGIIKSIKKNKLVFINEEDSYSLHPRNASKSPLTYNLNTKTSFNCSPDSPLIFPIFISDSFIYCTGTHKKLVEEFYKEKISNHLKASEKFISNSKLQEEAAILKELFNKYGTNEIVEKLYKPNSYWEEIPSNSEIVSNIV